MKSLSILYSVLWYCSSSPIDWQIEYDSLDTTVLHIFRKMALFYEKVSDRCSRPLTIRHGTTKRLIPTQAECERRGCFYRDAAIELDGVGRRGRRSFVSDF